MNSVSKVSRLVFAIVITLGFIGFSASTALADRPDKMNYSYMYGDVLTTLCEFPIDWEANVKATETDFYDITGALIRIHIHATEQDTFSANGKSLVGIPFSFNLEMLFDNAGNMTNNYGTGVVEKIPLPDGSLFISAGRVDFMAHPGAVFLLSPDKGNPGNVAGFCAALAP
jgi:hypothetical protein